MNNTTKTINDMVSSTSTSVARVGAQKLTEPKIDVRQLLPTLTTHNSEHSEDCTSCDDNYLKQLTEFCELDLKSKQQKEKKQKNVKNNKNTKKNFSQTKSQSSPNFTTPKVFSPNTSLSPLVYPCSSDSEEEQSPRYVVPMKRSPKSDIINETPIRHALPYDSVSTILDFGKEHKPRFDSHGRAKFKTYNADYKYITYKGDDKRYQFQCRAAYNRLHSRARHLDLKPRYYNNDFDRTIREGFEAIFLQYENSRSDGMEDRLKNGTLIPTYNRMIRRFDLFISIWEFGNYELVYSRLSQVIFPVLDEDSIEPQCGSCRSKEVYDIMVEYRLWKLMIINSAASAAMVTGAYLYYNEESIFNTLASSGLFCTLSYYYLTHMNTIRVWKKLKNREYLHPFNRNAFYEINGWFEAHSRTGFPDRIEPQGLFTSFIGSSENNPISEVTEALNRAASSINDAQHDKRIDDMMKMAKAFAPEQIGSAVFKSFAKMSLIVTLCTVAIHRSKTVNETASYDKLLACLGVITVMTYGPEIMAYLSNLKIFKTESDDVTPQLGGDSLMTAVVSMMVFASVGQAKSVPLELMRSLSSFDRVKSSLKEIYDVVIGILQKVLNYFGLFLPKSLVAFHVKNDEIREFILEVKEIEEKLDMQKFDIVQTNFDLLRNTIKKGESILFEVRSDKDTAGFLTIVKNSLTDLKRLKQKFIDANFTFEGMRQEPVSLLLRGGPGVLKSQSLEHFIRAIGPRSLPKEDLADFARDPNRFVHNRQAETTYWDGYDNKKAFTLYDDFGQQRDIAGNPDNEFMSFIRNVNEMENDLHMASLGAKGNVKFSSKFVLCTTNMQAFSVESITEIGALKRRFNLVYTVVPKDEYILDEDKGNDPMRRRVDPMKLPIGVFGETSTQPEVLNFMEFDLITEKHTGKILSFDEVVEAAVQMEQTKRRWFEQKKEELNIRSQKSLTRRQEIEFPKDLESCMERLINYDVSKYNFLITKTDMLFNYSVPAHLAHVLNLMHAADRVQYSRRVLYLEDWIDNPNYKGEFLIAALNEIFDYEFVANLGGISDLDFLLYVITNIPRDVNLQTNSVIGLQKESKFSAFIGDAFKKSRPLDRKYEEVKQYITAQTPEFFRNYGPALAILTGVSPFIVWGISWVTKKYFGASADPESSHRNTSKKISEKMNAEKLRQAFHPPTAPQVGTGDPQGNDILEKIRKRNCYEIAIENCLNSNDFTKLGFCIFIKGQVALMPYHFMLAPMAKVFEDPLNANLKVRLRKKNNDSLGINETFYTLRDIGQHVYAATDFESCDLCLVRFPRAQPAGNILEYFTTQKDLDALKDYPFTLIVPGVDQVERVHGYGTVEQQIHVKPDFAADYYIKKGLKYPANTNRGDCGALLSIPNPAYRKSKIFGMHVAGKTHSPVGYATFITQEAIIQTMETMDKEFLVDVKFDEIHPQSGIVLSRGQFESLYEIDKPVPQAFKTRIMKSEIYEAVRPAIMRPAHLRPFWNDGVLINPWEKALDAYCTENIPIDSQRLRHVTSSYKDYLFHNSVIKVPKVVYSLEEAIMGTDDPEYDPLNRQTSPGYPWVLDKKEGYPARTRFFGKDGDFDLSSDDYLKLKERIRLVELSAIQNRREEHVFVDCLKDENRPHEKVLQGKTRLFSACPLDLLILYRMYFGAYSLWYKKNRITNGSAIGINPYSFDWHQIAMSLLKFGNKDEKMIGAGDYSRYDGSEKPDVHYAILDVIQEWYDGTEEESRVRRILWFELVNSCHVNGKLIYSWPSSLPSGHPLTSTVNTMYNNIAYRWCWYNIHDWNYASLYQYDKHVWMIAMGDDSAFTVAANKREVFNEATISEAMKSFGLIYTAENKQQGLASMRTISEIDFLKRKFKRSEISDKYIAPLNLDKLLDILNWTKRGHDSLKITKDNITLVFEELSLHGPETFKEWTKKILKISEERLNYYPPITDYLLLVAEMSNRVQEW